MFELLFLPLAIVPLIVASDNATIGAANSSTQVDGKKTETIHPGPLVDTFVPLDEELLEKKYKECNLGGRGRPVLNYSEPLMVNTSFIPLIFRGIDDSRQIFTQFAQLDMSWQHPCLAWQNDPKYRVIPSISLTAQGRFWHPLIYHVNMVEQPNFFETLELNSIMNIYSSGRIRFSVIYIMSSFCELKLKLFPFDVQECFVLYESWDNSDKVKVQLQGKGISIAMDTFLSPVDVWELVPDGENATAYPYFYGNYFASSYYRFKFTLKLARRANLFILNIVLPSIALIVLLLFSGLINPRSVDRPLFAITVVLAFIFVQGTISESLPKTAELPHLFVFLNFNLFVGFFCSLYTIFTCNLARVPRFKRNVIFAGKLGIKLSQVRLLDIIAFALMAFITFLVDSIILLLMAGYIPDISG